jgi:hypothetical protein|tara:strand:+ start:603 stop:803 length:201 start_codon:yes stop_codon:yes gene_type:complete
MSNNNYEQMYNNLLKKQPSAELIINVKKEGMLDGFKKGLMVGYKEGYDFGLNSTESIENGIKAGKN